MRDYFAILPSTRPKQDYAEKQFDLLDDVAWFDAAGSELSDKLVVGSGSRID